MAVGVQSKPFGIQSPEQIAKDYGGNKQRIAEAMRLGIVDPTVGTLAGMFIDRMAAGAAQGQARLATIASQVFDPQTPPGQAPGGAGPGGLPMGMGPPPPDMGMGPPPPDMGMGMGMGAPPPDMGMGAPPPDMPMPPPSPEAMQPMGPGMADGGMVAFRSGGPSSYGPTESIPERSDVVNKYRLPPMREERHNNLLDLVRQFMNVNQRVGDANIRGRYDPLRNTSDYGVDVPVAGGNFRAGARSSRGLRPDSFTADYSHRLLGGDLNVGLRRDRGRTSGRVGYTREFADGGMVAFAQGGESRPLDLQSLLPFPEAGLPEEAGFADGGVASLPVPDDMFNSSVGDSDMQQYADGGMVAFAEGGRLSDDQYLSYILQKESRGRDYDSEGRLLRSPKGAMAAMQVMPDTARDPGFGIKPARDNSPEELNRVGRQLALKLRQRYGNDRDALMAYNWGPGNVDKWIAAGRPASMVPRETRNYVPGQKPARLAAASKVASNASDAPAATPAGLASAAQTGANEETRAMYDMMRAETAQRNEDRAADIAERMKDRAADKRDRKQAGWAALAQRGLAMMSPQGAEMPSLFADGGTVPGYAVAGPVANPYSKENVEAEMARLDALAPQSNVRRDKQMAIYDRETSEEYNRTERKQSANMALMNFGLALMASKNPNFLGAIGEAGAPAVAGMKADLKDLKKQFRDATFEAAQLEGFSNKESRERVNTAEAGIARTVAAAQAERQYNEDVRRFGIEQANDLEKARLQRSATIKAARIGAAGQADYMDKQLTLLQRQVAAAAVAQLDELRAAKNNPVGLANNAYLMAMQRFGAGKPETIKAYEKLQRAENAYVQSQVQLASGGMGAPSASGDGVKIVSATRIP